MTLAIGVALIIIGGLLTYFFMTSQSHTVTVLETRSDIQRGDTITAADLKTISITTGQGTGALTTEQSGQAVGKLALQNLPAGTFITQKNIGTKLPISAGSSVVGVAFTAAQMPGYQVTAGDKVRVVVTPVSQGEPPTSTPESYKATVFSTKWNSKSNQWVVDLIVSKSEAGTVAATGATGRVALVLDSDSQTGKG